jgi:hypothetical protein
MLVGNRLQKSIADYRSALIIVKLQLAVLLRPHHFQTHVATEPALRVIATLLPCQRI